MPAAGDDDELLDGGVGKVVVDEAAAGSEQALIGGGEGVLIADDDECGGADRGDLTGDVDFGEGVAGVAGVAGVTEDVDGDVALGRRLEGADETDAAGRAVEEGAGDGFAAQLVSQSLAAMRPARASAFQTA